MKEEKKESPIGVLWGWGKPYHGKFIGSIALAVLGVACQMVPYFCVAHIVTLMLSGDQNFSHYTIVGADNIVVVKDGTIHAQGTHEKLLETCPLYQDMWQAHIGAKDQM